MWLETVNRSDWGKRVGGEEEGRKGGGGGEEGMQGTGRRGRC